MDHIDMKQDKPLKCGIAIKILSVLSLVCIVLSTLPDYLHYADVARLIDLLLKTAPAALFVSYLFYFRNKPKSENYLAIVFGFFPLRYYVCYYVGHYIVEFLLMIVPFVLYVFYIFNRHDRRKAKIWLTVVFGSLLLPFLFESVIWGSVRIGIIVILLTYFLSFISVLEGFGKKKLFAVAMSGFFLSSVMSGLYWFLFDFSVPFGLYDFLESFTGGFSAFSYSVVVSIGEILLYTALLLFGLKNEVSPVVLPVSSKQKTIKPKKVKKMTPEQALRLLKTSFESGEISEEEYQTRRAEIISKL